MKMSSCDKAKQDAIRAIKAQEADLAKAEQAIRSLPSIVPASTRSDAQRKLAEAKRQIDAIKKGLGC
jgi:hypothetical protein